MNTPTPLITRLQNWEHVYPEDMDKEDGHLYLEAAKQLSEYQTLIVLLCRQLGS